MPTYVVTGASRGIGLEFVRQLSLDPENTVFGLVRNKQAASEKLQHLPSSKVHFIEADVTKRDSLQVAVEQLCSISSTVDVLINNAGLVPEVSAYTSLSDYPSDPETLENELLSTFQVNVLGVINTINIVLPLLATSTIKKVIAISSGLADDQLTNGAAIYEAAPYSISKAALNTAISKYSAKHKQSGILFMAISPGVVDTGKDDLMPEDSKLPFKFAEAFPSFQGPITPEESVAKMLVVIDKAHATNEYAGAFVSHYGNKTWL